MPTLKWKEPSEAEIEDAVITYLNYQPHTYAFKMHVKGTWNERGKFFQAVGKHVPVGGADVIFVSRGLFGCFEIKSAAGFKKFHNRPGDHEVRQAAFLARIRNKGGLAEVVCSVNQAEDHFKRWMKSVRSVL